MQRRGARPSDAEQAAHTGSGSCGQHLYVAASHSLTRSSVPALSQCSPSSVGTTPAVHKRGLRSQATASRNTQTKGDPTLRYHNPLKDQALRACDGASMGQIVACDPFRQEHALAAIAAIAALTAPAATLPRATALQPALAAAAPAALTLHAATPAAAALGCALLHILPSLLLSPLLLLLPILLPILLLRQLHLLLPLPLLLLGMLLPGVVLIEDVQRPRAADVPQPQLPVTPACTVQAEDRGRALFTQQEAAAHTT